MPLGTNYMYVRTSLYRQLPHLATPDYDCQRSYGGVMEHVCSQSLRRITEYGETTTFEPEDCSNLVDIFCTASLSHLYPFRRT